MEYFPSKLKERVEFLTRKRLPDNAPIFEILEQLSRKDYNKYCYNPHLLCHGDYLDEDCMYEYLCNPRLRNVVDWIMHKVVYPHISWETMEVRIRIAASMLNKVEIRTASENLRIIIQDNVVKNISDLFLLKTFDLPF